MIDPQQPAPADEAGNDGRTPRERTLDAADLLQGGTTVRIVHDGASYVLRLTRQNKLILTK